MSDVIEYCVSNVPPGVRDQLPESAEGRPCLRECGLCYGESFLAVDGDLVVGESHAELIADCEGRDE